MKIYWKLIISTIMTTIFFFAICYLLTYQEGSFNKIKLVRNNKISINHPNQFLDTITTVGVNILGLKGEFITILPMGKNKLPLVMEDYDLHGQVIEHDSSYYIYIKSLNKERSIEVIAHELLHLKQYEDKRITIKDSIIYWEGKPINIKGMLYSDYPWEIDIFDDQHALERQIREILY